MAELLFVYTNCVPVLLPQRCEGGNRHASLREPSCFFVFLRLLHLLWETVGNWPRVAL